MYGCLCVSCYRSSSFLLVCRSRYVLITYRWRVSEHAESDVDVSAAAHRWRFGNKSSVCVYGSSDIHMQSTWSVVSYPRATSIVWHIVVVFAGIRDRSFSLAVQLPLFAVLFCCVVFNFVLYPIRYCRPSTWLENISVQSTRAMDERCSTITYIIKVPLFI